MTDPHLSAEKRRFPVLQTGRPRGGIMSVPWALLAAHEAQAHKNHSQSLETLARRGGLSPDEMWCVVHDREWEAHPAIEVAEAWLTGVADTDAALAHDAERLAREIIEQRLATLDTKVFVDHMVCYGASGVRDYLLRALTAEQP